MDESRAVLAALVGSRLCHDLISPIGAIQNGLELVTLAGGTETGPEMALIQDSCDNASARIRFFRIAFGSANDGQNVNAREIASILAGVTRAGRLKAHWRLPDKTARPDAQLALLAYMCCESALPVGGDIAMSQDGGRTRITGTGPRTRVDPDAWSFLAGGGTIDTLTPDKVQFALLSTLARDRGRKLLAESDDSQVSVTIG